MHTDDALSNIEEFYEMLTEVYIIGDFSAQTEDAVDSRIMGRYFDEMHSLQIQNGHFLHQIDLGMACNELKFQN